MKKIIIPGIIICLIMICGSAGAQRGQVEYFGKYEMAAPVSQMVMDESGEWITLVSRDFYQQERVESDMLVQTDGSSIPARSSRGFNFDDKNYSSVSVSKNGKMAALSDDRKTIFVYDDPTNPDSAIHTIEPDFQILSCSVSANGESILVNSAEQIRTVIYNAADGVVKYDLTGFETAAPVYDSTLSADGNYLVWHSRGTFAVQNVSDGTFGKYISLWDFASGYALAPDNETLAVGMINDDYESGAILFFDPQSGKELGRVLTGNPAPYSLSYSNDGTVLWAVDTGNVYIVDPKAFSLLQAFNLCSGEDDDRISVAASSPDGLSAAVMKRNGELHLIHKPEK